MNNYDFVLENARFHLNKPNTLILIGWFKDDNPDDRTVRVEVNGQKQVVTWTSEKSIAIRQKYLLREANVSVEMRGELELSTPLEEIKTLEVYSCLDDKKSLSSKISGKRLTAMHDDVAHFIETKVLEDKVFMVSGWAVGNAQIDYKLIQKGKELNFDIERGYRRDVMAAFPEVDESYLASFKITASVQEKSDIKLIMTCDGHETVCELGQFATLREAGNVVKIFRWLRAYGPFITANRIYCELTGKEFSMKSKKNGMDYNAWRAKYEIKEDELNAQREERFDYNPKFSIVIPLYATNPKFLRELIETIIGQTYTNWELCLADGTGKDSPLEVIVAEYIAKDSRIRYEILSDNKGISENTNAAIKMATGEYIIFCDHDDIVPANALFECAKALNNDKSIDVIYSDEDKVDMKGKTFYEPHFKSDFNIDLLCSMNYICHLFVVKRELLDEVGMLRSEFDGAQDHDFILRCCEQAKNIHHIPKILYHWRCHMNSTAANPESKLYAFEAGRKAVEDHFKRIGIPAKVSHGQFYGMFKTTYEWEEQPLISIIIPNKDHIEDLKTVMNSIDEKSTYRNYEYVIVENNSTEKETFDFYKSIEKKENVTVLYYDGDFNFSRINNFGAKAAKGDYLLLLNNDTEIINPDCLWEMLGYCMREDVGIVGARLYYQDDTIQHAGVVVGFGGIAGHTFIGSSRFDDGYFSRIICAQDYSAVTAACLMTKKSVYEAVGGLSEEYKVAFNDIDYCMKVRRLGKLVVYNPAVELYHYESKSRGMEDTPEKVERFNSEIARFQNDWPEILKNGDPYFNVNLSLDKADFSLKE